MNSVPTRICKAYVNEVADNECKILTAAGSFCLSALSSSGLPFGPFVTTSVWRLDAGIMCPQEKLVSRSAATWEKSWLKTSDICNLGLASSQILTHSRLRLSYSTHWRHRPTREYHRPRLIHDLGKVGLGVE